MMAVVWTTIRVVKRVKHGKILYIFLRYRGKKKSCLDGMDVSKKQQSQEQLQYFSVRY